MTEKRLYPGQAYNLLTLLGVALALFGLAGVVILFVLSAFSGESNPYLGIFIFIVFPAVLVFGLMLIPLGMYRERRRRDRGASRPLILDLGNPKHRNATVTFIAGTCIFLLVTTVGFYQGYAYTESEAFCGEVCHVVMEPEHVAFQNSSHAKVECVACHIGPGAGWYVQSKLSGARQVFKTILGNFPRPIPTPIEALRPAQEVCEQCHWPEKFYAASQVANDHFLADEENTHWQITMLVKVGGTTASPQGHPSGIHWHIDESNRMTYVASDHSRQAFDQVTWWKGDEQVVYSRTGESLSEEELAAKDDEHLLRNFDCMDCHNRPSHNYRSPNETVNTALASGRLDPGLPWIKREAVTVLSREYWTKEGARDSIETALQEFYAEQDVEVPENAFAEVHEIYGRNMFPEMRVRWDRYPDNRGHVIHPGCFRCHGSELQTAEGETISADCNLCHTIVSQGFVSEMGDTLVSSGLPFRHPVDIDGAETEMPCYECHAGDDSVF